MKAKKTTKKKAPPTNAQPTNPLIRRAREVMAQRELLYEENKRLHNELASLRAAALQASKAALAVVEQCHLIGRKP